MFSSKDDADNGRFVGEPARASLTDPPPGYQVPSPDQPYGLGKDVGLRRRPTIWRRTAR